MNTSPHISIDQPIIPPATPADAPSILSHAADFLSSAAQAVEEGHEPGSLQVLERVLWAEAKLLELVRSLDPAEYAAAVRHVWGREPKVLSREM
ncbi:MAG: hypothetical protein AB7I34_05060 [Rhizobiaceae bacterium]